MVDIGKHREGFPGLRRRCFCCTGTEVNHRQADRVLQLKWKWLLRPVLASFYPRSSRNETHSWEALEEREEEEEEEDAHLHACGQVKQRVTGVFLRRRHGNAPHTPQVQIRIQVTH